MTTTRIPHDGSACPVSPGTKVTVWFRDGTSNALLSAKHWRWVNSVPKDDDIVSYAILTPDWAVEGPKLVDLIRRAVTDFGTEQGYDRWFADARTALSRIKQGEEK